MINPRPFPALPCGFVFEFYAVTREQVLVDQTQVFGL